MGDKVPTETEPIKIGAILPLTGPAASWAEQVQKGIELGYNSHPAKERIEVLFEDSASDVSTGVSAFQKLVSTNRIQSVITAFTPVSMGIAPLANENDVVMFAAATWGSAYSTPNDNTFRLDMNTKNASESLVEYIEQARFDNVAVFYSDDAFATDFFNSFTAAYAPKSVYWQDKFSPQGTDFRAQLTKLKSTTKPGEKNALFVISAFGSAVGQVVKQGTELGLDVEYLSLSTVQDKSFYDVAGAAGDGLVYVYPFDSKNRRSDMIIDAYQKQYGESPRNEYYVAVGYESIVRAMDAYDSCEKDNECVRKDLYGKEFETSFGKLSFDENGDVYFLPEIRMIKNSSPVLVN